MATTEWLEPRSNSAKFGSHRLFVDFFSMFAIDDNVSSQRVYRVSSNTEGSHWFPEEGLVVRISYLLLLFTVRNPLEEEGRFTDGVKGFNIFLMWSQTIQRFIRNKTNLIDDA